MQRLFTSESVTEGHPDKICDQISDSVLDAILAQDKKARGACDVAVNTGIVLVMGEITTSGYVDMQKVARDTIRRIGYVGGRTGFDADNCGVLVCIDGQSPDIAQGVDDALESRGQGVFDIGAGDQGMMFGYACNETDTLMPYAITAAHDLTRRLAYVRKQGILDFVLPDGKAQVTVEYDEASRPRRIDTVVVSSQHVEEVSYADLKEGIYEEVIQKTLDPAMLDRDTKILINPTGRFVVGGPKGDSGLTGRKIIVDSYGGYGRHGGGAFSGKDPTKVDRSAAYAARHVAKNIVAAGLADKCEIELAYAIGVARPVSVFAETFGTGKVSDERLAEIIRKHFDLRPAGIIDRLHLRDISYAPVAAYGHFGRRDLDLPWEKLDLVDALKEEL